MVTTFACFIQNTKKIIIILGNKTEIVLSGVAGRQPIESFSELTIDIIYR